MFTKRNSKRYLIAVACLGLLLLNTLSLQAQETKWMVVGELQSYYHNLGAEWEDAGRSPYNFLTWPTLYGDDQHTVRARGLWLGATDFDDPVENVNKSIKVIGIGPRISDNWVNMIFPVSFKLLAKSAHPAVTVDDQSASTIDDYDIPDEYDPALPADRVLVSKFNTSMGVTVTRKVLAFTQQNHDDYFIYDVVFKNTGIYNDAGDVKEQTLNNFYAYFVTRYAYAGVTSPEWGSTWGAFSSQWGSSTLLQDFRFMDQKYKNKYPDLTRGYFSWYGPTSSDGHPLTPQQDWGCPDHEETGVLGSAKYTGGVTLFASKGPGENYTVDDPDQPYTTAYVGSDGAPAEGPISQYNENFMKMRYDIMTEGKLDHGQADAVFDAIGNDGYVDDWPPLLNGYRSTQTQGSSSKGQGFGPYTLEPGDSIRIVYAEGVNGLSWTMDREVGGKWYAYFSDAQSKPDLIMPDGSQASSNNTWNYEPQNAYKRAWIETGVDSILQVVESARQNYESGFNIPQAPPAPSTFIVASGGDRIRLRWSNNAEEDPNFDGYVIYRSEGNVKDYTTVYTEIASANSAQLDTKFPLDAEGYRYFDDLNARRGFNYYYYIQSKDDGSQDTVHPGKPLYSSKFMTLTNKAAFLRRPAGSSLSQIRVVPNPYNIRARQLQFGEESTYDRLAFYGLPPYCQIKIFTERGDLIWSKEHNDGSGDELWDSITSSGQIIVSGIYLAYFEVSQNYHDPNTGELLFKKGDHIIRKFIVIR